MKYDIGSNLKKESFQSIRSASNIYLHASLTFTDDNLYYNVRNSKIGRILT
jgi:hypothetical protein